MLSGTCCSDKLKKPFATSKISRNGSVCCTRVTDGADASGVCLLCVRVYVCTCVYACENMGYVCARVRLVYVVAQNTRE